MNTLLYRIGAAALSLSLLLSLGACGKKPAEPAPAPVVAQKPAPKPAEEEDFEEEPQTEFTVGLCSYDAGDPLVAAISARLEEISGERAVTIHVLSEGCDKDSMEGMIQTYIENEVDLLIAVSTEIAQTMRDATQDIPIIFTSVPDPVAAGLVESLDEPGSNLTGTSNGLSLPAMAQIMLAAQPAPASVGLLTDPAWSAQTEEARAFLEAEGIPCADYPIAEETTLETLLTDKPAALFFPGEDVEAFSTSFFAEMAVAGIPCYGTNPGYAARGALLGCGVDKSTMGTVTAELAAEVLLDDVRPRRTAVRSFDATVAINTAICHALSLDIDALEAAVLPYAAGVIRLSAEGEAAPTEAPPVEETADGADSVPE